MFAVRQWLDQHVSFRLSILFAYLFGKSELAVQLLKWLGAAGNVCRAMLEPLDAYTRSVLQPNLAWTQRGLSRALRDVVL